MRIEYYIHIPFCIRKCKYCDFLSFPADAEVRRRYINALCEEIRKFDQEQEYQISTVFLGGGTPSILNVEEMQMLMSTIREYHAIAEDAEITMESNPGTLTEEKLAAYREHGINRLSMGVQSFEDDQLQLLGRIHSSEDIYRSFELARNAGFRNINLDLMSSLPGQTKENFLQNLKKAVALEPEHISAYSLIIEEGTPFYNLYAEDERRKEEGEDPVFLPSEDEERATYYATKDYLSRYGYERYEISNYAKPGKECRHNIGYWERAEYQGFGLGAASLIGNTRLSNETDMKKYLSGTWTAKREELSVQDQMEETMFLGLRMMRGVDKKKFYHSFKKEICDVYESEILELAGQDLLVNMHDKVCLTDKGIDISNYVMAKFLK